MHYINNNIKLIWYIRKLICLFWRLVKMEMENFESSPLFPCNFIKGQCTVCSDFAVHLRHQWISSTFTRDSFLYVWFNRRVITSVLALYQSQRPENRILWLDLPRVRQEGLQPEFPLEACSARSWDLGIGNFACLIFCPNETDNVFGWSSVHLWNRFET